MDFDTAVLAGPDTDGDCGTANDELTITSPSTTIPGVANLCGTLTGQHSKHSVDLWQYGLWSFQVGGTKLERFLPKNQHIQRKSLNFENWVNGEVSKIGHHFSK